MEYRKAQKIDPASGEIRAEIARTLREAGKSEEALAEAKEAVRLDPDSVDAHLVTAQLYQLRGEGDGAEEALANAAREYEEVVRLQPTDGRTILNLAALYSQLQKHKEAARTWEKYLELDPGNFDALIQLGGRYLSMGESEKAAATLEKALRLQPSSARAYQSLERSTAARSRPTRPSQLPQGGGARARQRPPAPHAGRVVFRAHRAQRPWTRPRPSSSPTPRTGSRWTSRAGPCAS